MRDIKLEQFIAEKILGLELCFKDRENFGFVSDDRDNETGEPMPSRFPPISSDEATDAWLEPIWARAAEMGLTPVGTTHLERLLSIRAQYQAAQKDVDGPSSD